LGVGVPAGWDHDSARLAKARDAFGIEACDSADELLARDDLDGVVIGAETNRHADLVERAAEAGLPIALQKPLALTLDEADRIVEAVRRTGVPFTLCWQMRADPQNLTMRRLVAEGTVGRVLMLRRRHGLSTHLWSGFENTWHADPRANRDIWADDSHPVDFIDWLLGRPASVSAELGTLVNPRVPNDNGIALFRYDDGTFAEVVCSFTCPAAENTTEIVGTDGTIVQNYGDGPSANVPRPPGATPLKWIRHGDEAWTVSDLPAPDAHGERIAHLAEPLAAFFAGRGPAIASAAEGRDTLRMILACYEASESGRRVRFDWKD
jgi:predicted dehydrogenase